MEAWKNRLNGDPISWLLESEEPWTRYRTKKDLLNTPADSPELVKNRIEILEHPKTKELIKEASEWLPIAAMA